MPYTTFDHSSRESWRLLSAGFINAMGLMIVVYISLYLSQMHFSIKYIGFFLTIFGIAGVIGGYCGGIMSEYLTPLKICKLSLFMSSLLLFLFPLCKNYYLSLMIASVLSYFLNMFRPAFILAMANDGQVGSLENLIALRRVAINLGMAFGAAVGGYLASIHYSWIFLFNGMAALLSLFVIFTISDEKIIPKEKKARQNDIPDNNVIIFFLLFLMFLILIIFNQSQVIYPLFIKNNLMLNEKFISFLFVISGLIIAFLQMPITHALSNKKSGLVCAIGTLLISIGFAILPWLHTRTDIIISCVTWTLGEIILFPSQLAMLIRLSADKKGKVMGLYQMIFSLASFLSPLIGTTLYSYNT